MLPITTNDFNTNDIILFNPQVNPNEIQNFFYVSNQCNKMDMEFMRNSKQVQFKITR